VNKDTTREPITFVRERLKGNFTQVPNHLYADDCPLSPLAVYVLGYLMSRKDGYTDTMEDMWKRLKHKQGCGRRMIREAWRELEDNHYIKRDKHHLPGGTWQNTISVQWFNNPETWHRPTGTGIAVSPGETRITPGRTALPVSVTPSITLKDITLKEDRATSAVTLMEKTNTKSGNRDPLLCITCGDKIYDCIDARPMCLSEWRCLCGSPIWNRQDGDFQVFYCETCGELTRVR
jgi:hypothetical protein